MVVHAREPCLDLRLPEQEIAQLLVDYERRGEPLPMVAEHTVRDRLAASWSPEDPLTPISLGLLARGRRVIDVLASSSAA